MKKTKEKTEKEVLKKEITDFAEIYSGWINVHNKEILDKLIKLLQNGKKLVWYELVR